MSSIVGRCLVIVLVRKLILFNPYFSTNCAHSSNSIGYLLSFLIGRADGCQFNLCLSFQPPKKISVGLFHTKSKATWNQWTCQLIDSGISRFHIPFMWTCFPGLYIPYIIYIYNGLVFKNSKLPVLFYVFCKSEHLFIYAEFLKYLLFTIKISVGTCFFVQNLGFGINCRLKNHKPQISKP
jgi:hypothetical protein